MFGTKIKKRQAKIISLLNSLPECTPEEKKQKIQSIQGLYALELFDMKKYPQALAEFFKLNTDPAEVIKLFLELDGKSTEEKVEVKKIKGKDLESALNALIQYLIKVKKNILELSHESGNGQTDIVKECHKQQLELIDTTLLKCYLETKQALVTPLLRANNCNLEEAEKTLLRHGKNNELVLLYQMKEQHEKALEILREQSKRESAIEVYQRTANYLQQLGSEHLSLIFKFSAWILKEDPDEGLKIFTATIEAVEKLPRPKIFNFLLRDHEMVVIPYLEHVIHIWNDTDALFHNALIDMYRDKLTVENKNSPEEDFQNIKSKLLSFLEASTYYTPKSVLLHFPQDSMFEERAIVLGKLGRHEQALAIHVLILGDINRAIHYAEKVSAASSDKYQDVFVSLMRIIMYPNQCDCLDGLLANVPRHPKTSVGDNEIALHILEKYIHKISPLKALSVLPDSVPLIRLKQFFASSLDVHSTMKRHIQILKGLSYAEHIYVQELQEYFESQSVVINEYDICHVCKRRFGNQSAFVRYPNGEIVHYSCKLNK
ncbi:unnamed protein product [Arctia plantaginis]|uniref:Vam6/Vps39-like protein n=1 Tax=Arctia plantaginis TaxID=874455 RepID=A0A8S1AKI8_ARCPL|nr:unnamed protein product [Arctia plantaginis]